MDGFQAGGLQKARLPLLSSPEPSARGRISVPVFLALVGGIDILFLALAWAIVASLGTGGWQRPHLVASILAVGITSWGLRRSGMYDVPRLRRWGSQCRAALLPLCAGAVIYGGTVAALVTAAHDPLASLLWGPSVWLGLSVLAFAAGRCGLARMVKAPALARRLSRTIAIFGANALSQRFIERLNADGSSNDHVVGVFDDRRSRIAGVHAGVPVLGRIEDLLSHGRQQPIDAIVVALPLSATARITDVCDKLRTAVSDVYLTADTAGVAFEPAQFRSIGRNPVIIVSTRPLGPTAALQKRLFDLAITVALLVLIAPLLALISLAIKINSPGPVMFRQRRRGFNNNDFTVFKFRTMHAHLGDPAGRAQTIRNDPRVTSVGRLLRSFSFDELPQLFNVVRGDMSLVGPRPHALKTRAGERLLEDAVADYALRHRVKPGITGWAQVNGSRGPIRSEAQLRRRVDCDLYYIANWSVWLDCRILAMTLRRDVHQGAAF